jgi:hypothetical protein
MNEQDFLDSQTIFTEEEPLFETSHKSSKKTQEVREIKKPRPLLFLVGLVVFGGLMFGAGMLITRNRKVATIAPEITPTPTIMPVSPNQVDQLMQELQVAVDSADPSETSLAFPPVSADIKVSQ